jgi:hypothetical protein
MTINIIKTIVALALLFIPLVLAQEEASGVAKDTMMTGAGTPGLWQHGTNTASTTEQLGPLRGAGMTTASSTPTTPVPASSGASGSGIKLSGRVIGGVSAAALIGTNNGGELLTAASDFDSRCANTKVVNFDQFIFDPPLSNIPSVGESITYTSPDPNSSLGNEIYGLGSNGSWNSGRGGFIGTGTIPTFVDFRFDAGLKCCVGGFVNYSPTGEAKMQALDNSGNVLSTFDYVAEGAPISTPGRVNEGAFRGIFRAACDIRTIRILDAFQVLDDLTYGSCPFCQDSKDETKVSVTTTTTTLFGSCKEKCIPASQVDKFETLGYKCGRCDEA